MTSDAGRGRVGLWGATALVISHTIAVGIFLTPAEMIGAIASPPVTLALWLGGGLLVLAGAFTFGELASRYPRAGGLYVYLREAWGPRVAFLYGWQSLLIMDPGVIAALSAGAAQYVAIVWPRAALHPSLVAAGMIWGLTALNMAGLRFGARVFGLMTLVKLCTLLAVIAGAVFVAGGQWANFAPPPIRPVNAPPMGEAIAIGLVSVFFSFGGFWEASRIAPEVRDPRRTLPRALIVGVVAVTLIYVATTLAFVYVVPPASVTTAADVARRVGEAILGPAGPVVLAVVVLASVVASAMAMLLVSPRLYEAMGADGLFPGSIVVRSRVTGAPVRATALLAVLATIYVSLGTFEQIVTFFVGSALVFIGLAAAALLVVRRRDPVGGGYRAPGYPITPIGFVLFVLAVALLVAINRPWQALAGVGAVLAGALVAGRLTSRPAGSPGDIR